ncbi:Melanopsin [Acropora cervicornis]|uniref:Melanopsin n=1 Tax=Acropora cervicornis TaxID=6130 RepID=A0AAD9R6X5_ACRCE|nr:Melanopsin [Acropora cervicornis]
MQFSREEDPPSGFNWNNAWFIAYGVVMIAVLSIGFLGNTMTVIILRKHEHASKSLTPLMINLAIASLIIIVLGYPLVISLVVRGSHVTKEDPTCRWSAFINGTVGISSIATLTEMSLVINYSLHRMNPNVRLTKRNMALLIAGAWLYGLVSMFPPLVGWNRFVPGAVRISCGPDWTDKLLRSREMLISANGSFQLRQKLYIKKLVRMTVLAIAAFMLSWAPYCFVSILAIFKGSHIITSGEAEIPELMAKASVIYNPVVYLITNSSYRASFWKVISCQKQTMIVHVRENLMPNGPSRRTLRSRRMAVLLKPLNEVSVYNGGYVVAMGFASVRDL